MLSKNLPQGVTTDSWCISHNADTHNIIYTEVSTMIRKSDDPENSTIIPNPMILKLIFPKKNELVQLLHHALVYHSNSGFFLIGGDSDLMAIYRVSLTMNC